MSSACCAGLGLRPRPDSVRGRRPAAQDAFLVASTTPDEVRSTSTRSGGTKAPSKRGSTPRGQRGGGWPPVSPSASCQARHARTWRQLPARGRASLQLPAREGAREGRDAPSDEGDVPLSQGPGPGRGGGGQARVPSPSLSPSPNAPTSPRQGVRRQRLPEPGDCLSLGHRERARQRESER
jgi:hypothetical protein